MRQLRSGAGRRPRRRHDDRGAVAVFTAVFMAGALLALGMIAVDVGQSYDEHRQLRNGADAAAVAVAQSCARNLSTSPTNPCSGGTGSSSLATVVANANADDGKTTVEAVCGTAPGLPTCPAASGTSSLSRCPAVPANSPAYVEVRTRTQTSTGNSSLDPIFATAPNTVHSCARAAYGSPGAILSTLPLTFSKCLLKAYTGAHGGQYAPGPPYSPSTTAFKQWETVVQFHQAGGQCATTSSGQNAPGNFGYLDDTGNGPCQAYTAVNSTVGGDTGNGNPANRGCSDTYLSNLLNTVVYLPVFDPDKTTGSGQNVEYTVIGYMGLYFTGWKLTSTSHASTASGSSATSLCPNPQTCIFGYFVRGLVPSPGTISATTPDFGASIVQLVG